MITCEDCTKLSLVKDYVKLRITETEPDLRSETLVLRISAEFRIIELNHILEIINIYEGNGGLK